MFMSFEIHIIINRAVGHGMVVMAMAVFFFFFSKCTVLRMR